MKDNILSLNRIICCM